MTEMQAAGAPINPSPLEEAIEILTGIVRECHLGDPDLKSVLRRCTHAAWLIDDTDAQTMFSKETSGYSNSDQLPDHRHVTGSVRWKSTHISEVGHIADTAGRVKEEERRVPERRMLEFRDDVDSLTRMSESGLQRPAADIPRTTVGVKAALVKGRQKYSQHDIEACEYFPPASFKQAATQVRENAYQWAMRTLVRLKYENRISALWEAYRVGVDGKLAEINLTDHLEALNRQLASSNEQDWRSALYSCRNMLRDVADYLWKAPDKTVKLPDKNGKLKDFQIDVEKYVIRLNAYLYYKTRSTDETKLARTEAEYLGELIGRVNAVDNNAHEKTDKALAESAAIHTYILIADLIRLTDMEPITEVSASESLH